MIDIYVAVSSLVRVVGYVVIQLFCGLCYDSFVLWAVMIRSFCGLCYDSVVLWTIYASRCFMAPSVALVVIFINRCLGSCMSVFVLAVFLVVWLLYNTRCVGSSSRTTAVTYLTHACMRTGLDQGPC